MRDRAAGVTSAVLILVRRCSGLEFLVTFAVGKMLFRIGSGFLRYRHCLLLLLLADPRDVDVRCQKVCTTHMQLISLGL